MCQISVVNLHDDYLNAKMFLLLGTVGSLEHGDGWGAAKSNGKRFLKTGLPMNHTTNSGDVLLDLVRQKNPRDILLGHIRKASPLVPICDVNSHPFELDGVVFVHNGKLTPKDEKKFVVETSETSIDPKDGKTVTKFTKRSDSLVFFEYFMKLFKENSETDLEKKFVAVLKQAMGEFYGKFAMVFIIQGVYFIARGKTADLDVTYLKKGNEEVGWVVNTSAKLLTFTTTLLSNLAQLDGRPSYEFTVPVSLDKETVYVADGNTLRKIGEVLEGDAPKTSYAWENGASNFTSGTGTKAGTNGQISPAVALAEKVFKFMDEFSLTLPDIHALILANYNASTLDTTESLVKHFCNVVIPMLKNSTTKQLKKRAQRDHPNGISIAAYLQNREFEYPWLLNTKERQAEFLDKISTPGGSKK